MTKTDLIKWIWLSQCAGAGSYDAVALISGECNIDEIYDKEYTKEDYSQFLNRDLIDRLNDKDLFYSEQIYDYCEQRDILPVPFVSRYYPPKLREIQNPPILLYYKGNKEIFSGKIMLGCVGTRKCSYTGVDNALNICDGIARSGMVIVSGMAKGIDSVCAAAALNANKPTVAVLGCGVDVIYPPENSELYDRISRSGLIISEYPPQTEPDRRSFPTRNRIISGISNGVFVVEAGLNSGAMITAHDAFYQGRDVFAIPGAIDSALYSGTNSLIQNGAKLVTCANDIIVEYQFSGDVELIPVKRADLERLHRESEKRKAKRKSEDNNENTRAEQVKPAPILMSKDERAVFEILTDTPAGCDDIAEKAGLDMARTSAVLMMLQVKGYVKDMPGNMYVRNLKG